MSPAHPSTPPAPSAWFDLVTVAIPSTNPKDSWSADDVNQARDSVATALEACGGAVTDWTTGDDVRQRLATWKASRRRAAILYWTSHGELGEFGYEALLPSGERLTDVDFARALSAHFGEQDDDQADWILLILDTCKSDRGAWEIYQRLSTPTGGIPRPNAGILATANEGPAYCGAFPRALEEKLASFTDYDNGIKIGELTRRLTSSGRSGRLVGDFTDDAFIPLPDGGRKGQVNQEDYVDLREVLRTAPPHVRDHFYPKAQGAEVGPPVWWFRGREQERLEISDWLRSATHGLYIMTGVAGSGKSAILGMLLATSDPQMLKALEKIEYHERNFASIPALFCPPPDTFTAVVHLSGRSLPEAVAELASQLNVPSTANADELMSALDSAEAGKRTLLLDALDESRDPYAIAGLIRRLASAPLMKVLVGTRQSLREDPDHPHPPDRYLLDCLGAPADITRDAQGPTKVMVLHRDPTAIRDYITARLQATLPPGTPDRDNCIVRLTHQIGTVDQPFLFARLAAHEVVADLRWLKPGADLADLLSGGHTGIFDRAVARLRRHNPRIEALLHSLAYARGNGFPRTGGIWAIAGNALLQPNDGTEINDDDIDHALKLAAPYIMLGAEFGDSTYRLAHRTFTDRYLSLDERDN